MRTCRVCQVEFQPPVKAGPQPQFCSVECRKRHRAAYVAKWLPENREKVSARRKANADQVRQWNRDFYARHRDRRKALRLRRYHEVEDKSAIAKTRRDKYHRDLERYRKVSRKSAMTRRARKLKAFVEYVDPNVVFTASAGVCGICHRPVDFGSKWHVDHIVPLAKGGCHSYANVQLAHGACNIAKGARTNVTAA